MEKGKEAHVVSGILYSFGGGGREGGGKRKNPLSSKTQRKIREKGHAAFFPF